MNRSDLITIILPVYNGAKTIQATIESVLQQNFTQWRMIVIDDGSIDESEEIISSYIKDHNSIEYIKNDKNVGLQKTLNRALAMVNTKYVARIDQDDVWSDNLKLSKQIDFLEKNPQVVLVGTNAYLVDTEGERLGTYIMPKDNDDIRSRILSRNCFLHASVLFKTDVVRSVGGYSETDKAYCVEDYDLWLRLCSVGEVANIDSFITITVRPDSITARNRLTQARNSLRLVYTYYKMYPNALWGCCVGVARLAFFSLIRLFPFLGKFVYSIQVAYKGL